MTPDKAKQLLERVKKKCPLPWEIFTDETIAIEPQQVQNIRYQDENFNGHLAYVMDHDGTVEIDPDAIELIAAAPELAEMVASMRVEYAVQYFFHGEWQDTRYRRDTKQEAELVRDLYPQYDTRVVRRLTTEWEVPE